jgi:hypothetical protein
MASSNQYSISSIHEGLEHVDGIYGPRAHQVDDADVGWILLSGSTSQIGSRVGAPVAKKGYNPWFKFRHLIPPSQIAWRIEHGA